MAGSAKTWGNEGHKPDRRKGMNWLRDWKIRKRKKELQNPNRSQEQDKIIKKKAVALIKTLRKAAKKAKMFEVRKRVRKIAAAKEDAKEKGDTSIAKLERQLEGLRRIDVDAVVNQAVAAVPNIDPSLVPKPKKGQGKPAAQPVPVTENPAEEIQILLRTAAVTKELRALAEVVDPELAAIAQEERRKARDMEQEESGSGEDGWGEDGMVVGDSDESDGGDGGDGGFDSGEEDGWELGGKRRREEEEKVAAMLGEKKNRPGQRMRRKLIMQKYGKDAKVFKEARERKMAAKRGEVRGDRGDAGTERSSRGVERSGGGEEGREAAAGPVHGSWEAKKREKEAIAAAVAGGGTGQKIRFDDDGEEEGKAPPRSRGQSYGGAGGGRGGRGGGGAGASRGRAGKVGGGEGRSFRPGSGERGGGGRRPEEGASDAKGPGHWQNLNLKAPGPAQRGRGGGRSGGEEKALHPSWEARRLAREAEQRRAEEAKKQAPKVHIRFDD